jgi:UDP-N-acetyl-D-glucosamine dehydrogenase
LLDNIPKEINKKNCVIEIFGLGYVGLPLAVRLASSDFLVIGIDVNQERISNISNYNLNESQWDIKNDLEKAHKNGKLHLSNNSQKQNVLTIGIISVPTPISKSNSNSSVHVISAVENFLNIAKNGDVIILESSLEVGTTEEVHKLIESKGFIVGKNFGLAYCPERIDPQNKKWNLENIPRVVYCSDDQTFDICKFIYNFVNKGNLVRVSSPKVAEVIKSFENSFRLVNISLVNELAILCDKLGINVREVIDGASTKPFGYSPFYTGAGAGGHCIPKDPSFLVESSKKFGLTFQAIENALKINTLMPKYVAQSINKIFQDQKIQNKSAIICGLSYKIDLEDMRDSPGFKIMKEMKNLGFKVVGYDPFYKTELTKKYHLENDIFDSTMDVISNLNDHSINNFSCLCIVQHHTKLKSRIDEIYSKSLIPIIYDCQNKIQFNPKSNTFLKTLGS